MAASSVGVDGASAPAVSRVRVSKALKLALITCAVFASSLLAGFVYDDKMLIVENDYAHHLKYIVRNFGTHFWDTSTLGEQGIGLKYYRPLVSVSYLVNWLLSGGSAWMFHATNVLLHAATVYLAVRVARRWLGSARLALFAAAVFAVHPTRTESVVWIAGRTDVMMALFALGSVRALQFAAETENERRRNTWCALAAASGLASLLSKETGVLVTVFYLFDWYLAKERGGRASLWLRAAGVAGAASASYIVARMIWLPVNEDGAGEFTPLHGFMTIGYYVERILFPWPQTFFFRPLTATSGVFHYSMPHVAVGILASLLALALFVWALRRDRVLAWLIALSALALGPVLNFRSTGIFVSSSDHFLYLPLWFMALCLARWLAPELGSRLGKPKVALIGAGLAMVSGAVVLLRSLECKSDETLWASELALNPDNPFVLREVAKAQAHEGNLAVAAEFFERSLLPASTRYRLLADPLGNATAYFALLHVTGARVADGDVRSLRLLFDEMSALADGHSGGVEAEVHGLRIGRKVAPEVIEVLRDEALMEPLMASEAALIATRLGRLADARRLLARVPNKHLRHMPNALNIVLAHARIGDFDTANQRIDYLYSKYVKRKELGPLRQRVARAKSAIGSAETKPEPERSLERAGALAELGAYLRALQILRPVVERAGIEPPIGPQYIQLLVAAGLKQEAVVTLARYKGREKAERMVAAIASRIEPTLGHLLPVSEPSPWWPTAP